ncbi:MAG: succinyl-CoA synthetase beta subunit, partial [bacterium]
MNIHEYQAKEILKSFGVAIQEGVVINDAADTESSVKKLQAETGTDWVVVKAQIHAGGRGKGGGVKLAKNIDQAKQVVNDILGMQLVTP